MLCEVDELESGDFTAGVTAARISGLGGGTGGAEDAAAVGGAIDWSGFGDDGAEGVLLSPALCAVAFERLTLRDTERTDALRTLVLLSLVVGAEPASAIMSGTGATSCCKTTKRISCQHAVQTKQNRSNTFFKVSSTSKKSFRS